MAEAAGANAAGLILTELARAKVNLTLRIVGRRPDGYHELVSFVAFTDIGDEITLAIGAEPQVSVTGSFAADISGRNLVAEALSRLGKAEPRLRLGAVTIEKNLPVAAGLGGGSADAAATLRAVRRANPEFAGTFDWHGLAAGLGADVPVCLANAPALMWGIGEKVRAVHGLPPLPAVLANPGVPVPPSKSAEVFRRLAAPAVPRALADPEPPPAFASLDDAITYLQRRANDLSEPARDLIPACREVEAALATCIGCRLVRISGAGPTCYGLFTSPDRARSAAATLSQSHPRWWVRAVTLA